MKKELNEGELAFLPSNLVLLQFSEHGTSENHVAADTNPVVKKFHKIPIPAHALVVECKKETPYCVVLYNGERWMATKKDIYPLEVN